MPCITILDMSPHEQAHMLATLRRARYGFLLALPVLLLCAAGHTPTEIAAFLFCSRSSIYRIVRLYRAGHLGLAADPEGQLAAPGRMPVLVPWVQQALDALLASVPSAYGWCRTRWSCATLAMELQVQYGLTVSLWTVRRWLHAMGWGWKRAKGIAKDDAPQRVERLAQIRWQAEHLQADEVMSVADELDIHLLPKIGAAWMPKGTQGEVMTPGINAKRYVAGALNLAPGEILHCLGLRKTNALFRDLLTLLERAYPATHVTRIVVVVDNYCIHKAKAVEPWLASHPRFPLLWLPTYCPRANPIERAFGDVPDKCTRNHTRQHVEEVPWDVERHLCQNGPWLYKLSRIYEEPEVTAAVARIATEHQAQMTMAAYVYESYAL